MKEKCKKYLHLISHWLVGEIHNKPGLNDGHYELCPSPIIRIALRQDYEEKISISKY
jgi:hypothetical protein